MPAVQRSEFALALNQVASERGVEVSVVLETVENAILAAFRKDHPGIELEEYRAELNQNTGEAHIFHNKKLSYSAQSLLPRSLSGSES